MLARRQQVSDLNSNAVDEAARSGNGMHIFHPVLVFGSVEPASFCFTNDDKAHPTVPRLPGKDSSLLQTLAAAAPLF